jgi:hypothetical protein
MSCPRGSLNLAELARVADAPARLRQGKSAEHETAPSPVWSA